VIKLQWVKIRTHKHITTLKRYLIYLPLQESYKQFFFLHYKRVSQSDHDFVTCLNKEVLVNPSDIILDPAIEVVHLNEFQSNMVYLSLFVVCKDIKY